VLLLSLQKFIFLVKFLVIRFSSIGDIVLTTPVIRALKQQVEGSEIHFLVKPAFRQVVENNPYIDKIHVLHERSGATVSELHNEHFDYIIDLQKNLRSNRIKRRLGLVSFTFPKLNYAKWLLVNFGINKLPDVHIVDRYFEAVKVFDVKNDFRGLDYFLPDETEEAVKKAVTEAGAPFVVFVTGAKHFTKQIPLQKAIEICRLCPFPVILVGGPADAEQAEEIAQQSGGHVINMAGKCSLHGSAYIISKCTVVVTPDTGMMHIAAAFQKNIVSVWGNTIPEFGMYPYVDKTRRMEMEVTGLKCRPCTKIGFSKCPKGHFRCMNDISAQQAVAIISKLV
jgi:ADP-heptose:LPS heptosyltransferase